MKIWMWPKYSETNKYNELLSNSLIEKGIVVENYRRRFIFKLKRNNILHMHWIHSVYQSNIRILFILKSIIFFLKLIFYKIRGVKIIWTVHNIYPHSFKYKKLEKWIRSSVLKIVNKVIVASESIKIKLITELNVEESKIFVIPHGHYKGVYKSNNIDFKQKYNIPKNNYVFLFFGAIKPYKGVLELVEVFNSCGDKNSTLIVAGNPTTELYNKLNNVNSKNIVFDLRFIPDEEIYDIIKCSDVVVLPYKEVTTSGTAILALSLYRPIVAPKTNFLNEYFDEYTSYLYDSKETSLIDALIQVKTKEIYNVNRFIDKLNDLNWSNIATEIIKCYKN